MQSTADKVLEALRPFDLKQRGNEYRCNSPLRPGSNSHGFTVKIEGPELGAYFDHVTEETGSLYDLAKAMGIAVPTSTAVQTTKRAYEGLEDYARAHGISPEVLERWHWREVSHKGRQALQFPTRTGTRWRFLDGKKPVYISELNYQRCWYGLSPECIEQAGSTHRLVICNGEISTVTAQRYNIPCIAMTGGEKSELPSSLVSELKGKLDGLDVKIIIAMDCDAAGRKSGRGIAIQLKNEGFNAVAVDLALSTGGDLADFCMLHEHGAFKALQELKPLIESDSDEIERNWRVASIRDILAAEPIQWLLPGMIPANGLSVLFGESGTYKSFLALHYALKIAQSHPVVYIAAEGESGYKQRLEAWFKQFGQGYFTDKLTFILGSPNLFHDEDLYEFARVVEVYKPKLIIADTLSMTIGEADTNSGRDMIQVFQSCKRLIRDLNTSILLVHHTNAEGKRATGSQRIKDSVDTMIRLSRIDDVIAVESKKSKDTKLFETFYLKEVEVQLGYKNNFGEEVTSLVLMPSEKVQRTDDLSPLQHDVLNQIGINGDQSYADLADLLEVSRNSIASAISRLVKKGYIERVFDKYELTNTGKAVIDSNDSNDSTQNSKTKTDNQAESVESMESWNQSQSPLFDMPEKKERKNYDHN